MTYTGCMESAVLAVNVGSVLAIIWIVWFFFLSQGRGVRVAADAGVQEVTITVKGGYDPDTVIVQRGRPVRLKFFRDETDSCSDTVVLGDFGISRRLPAFETTEIEFTPERAGTFVYTCGMSMLRGRIVVEDKA